jgi:DNA modification methylase
VVAPFFADDWLTVFQGDCRTVLEAMPADSIHCVVTSPPYWGLRDYGNEGQLGLESTPELYVEHMVAVFREVRRVLRKDGTLWLNLGDSYAGSWGAQSRPNGTDIGSTLQGGSPLHARQIAAHPKGTMTGSLKDTPGLKPKDLVGIPWRVAFALQADGWYLRSDIIWAKPNPMPESVTDRPTKSHEYLFLLTKSARYWYDAEAVREPALWPDGPNSPESIASPFGQGFTRRAGLTGGAYSPPPGQTPHANARERNVGGRDDGFTRMPGGEAEWAENGRAGRNLRSVWTIATQPYPGAHFATFPRKLVEPCVKAGCPTDGTVLDPFAGSGTTGMVAQALGRKAILIDLNPDYLMQAMARNAQTPLGLVG